MPYSRAWCISERQGSIEMLLKRYKFERAKSAYVVIAELLHETLPVLPPETIIVSVPTVQSHIRRRGYDHASLIAKELARRRILPYKPLLLRAHNSVQLGATKKVRHQQASVAYTAQKNNEAVILLVDDVFTTGATAYFSAKALRDAGAQDVFLAVVARQALEKSVEY